MENTFALWGFITAGCIAVILVYATIADRWYKLQAQVADLESEKDNMQRWLDKQRKEILHRDDEIADLLTKIRYLDSKLDSQRAQQQSTPAATEPAKKHRDTKRDRSKGFTANNDIKVWHKCVPSTALARVQARINKGDQWANIYASNSGWVIKIVQATREYRSQVFADRNRAKQFRDVMLSSYFAAKPGKMGGKQ